MMGGVLWPEEWPTPNSLHTIPDYPRDIIIYCTGCGCHYDMTAKSKDDLMVCPTNEEHRLGESVVTKMIADTEKKRQK